MFLIPPERRQGAMPMTEGGPDMSPPDAAKMDMTPLPDPGLGKLAEEVDKSVENSLKSELTAPEETEGRDEQ